MLVIGQMGLRPFHSMTTLVSLANILEEQNPLAPHNGSGNGNPVSSIMSSSKCIRNITGYNIL